MPKLSGDRVPKYRRHGASGQAVVGLNGRDHYLGKYDSPESRGEYERLVGEWLVAGRRSPTEPDTVTVMELVHAFREHRKADYPNDVIENFDQSFRPLLRLFGRLPAAEFGPLRLKTLREAMINTDRSRGYINRLVGNVKFLFKWGVANELVPPSVHQALVTVAGLRLGEKNLKESKPVGPVAVEYINAVLTHVSRQVAAMIQLQLLTGCRPGEVCQMRTVDLDMSGPVWFYRPQRHKTAHHGHSREIYLGPKAQEIVKPWLLMEVEAYLFSPAQAEAERLAARKAARKTPAAYGNGVGTNRVKKPKRRPGKRYTTMSYYSAVLGGCDKAGVPRWGVNQLRHTAATELRKRFGLEAVQPILGHAELATSQIYAEQDRQTAMRIMKEVG